MGAETAQGVLQEGAVDTGIVIESLTVRFGHHSNPFTALDRVDLSIQPGEFVAILGPSGCGKSTLLNVIAGFHPATEGSVRMRGVPIGSPGADRSVVFQQHSLFPWMTVIENVAFGPRALGRPSPLKIATHYLELVGLQHFAQHYPSALSGGMRQRVGLARALAVEPSVLLMDEPFGALDAQTRSLMQEQLLEIRSRLNCSILFITHDIEEAIYLADRIVVLGVKPNRVKGSFPVDLPLRRDIGWKRNPKYIELQENLFALIRQESLKSFKSSIA